MGKSRRKQSDKKRGHFFVIMPYNDKYNRSPNSFKILYKKLFKPVLEDLEFTCEIANESSFMTSNMLKEVLSPLCIPKNYVLADLTGQSPNVFYELGVRHALAKSGTILITQSLDDVPFDLKHQHVIEYSGTMDDEDDFKKKIEDRILRGKTLSPVPEMVEKYDEILGDISKWKVLYEEQKEQIEKLASFCCKMITVRYYFQGAGCMVGLPELKVRRLPSPSGSWL